VAIDVHLDQLFVLGINLLKDVMNLLLEGLDPFNKYGCMICLGMSVGGLFR
jgi:hypothetical protein